MGNAPTDLVRDGEVDSVHPLAPSSVVPGFAPSPSALSKPGGPGRKRLLIGAGLIALVLVLAFAGWRAFADGASSEDRYLDALDDAGLRDDFAADRAALAAAIATCEDLDGGSEPQGSEAQLIAVEEFCPDYAEAFRVLEVDEVVGTFTITDGDYLSSETGDLCQGEGGYGDLNPSTQVVVTNPAGDELARTELGFGETRSAFACQFEFTVELTEGEDTYIFEVGDRGEISYTWDEATAPGAIAFTIG